MYLLYHFFICFDEAGADWKPIRKNLNTSFNSKVIRSFMPIFNEKSDILLEKLKERENDMEFEITPYTTITTLDIVCGK